MINFVPALLLASEQAGRVSPAFTLLLVFGAAKLLAEGLEYFGQPGVVGEILAGVLLGPSLLNLVSPNESLHTLANLGVLFLLFRVGMEMKPSDLMRLGGRATVVAVSGVIVPFVMGWGGAVWLGRPHAESIFVGAALVATSVGITAQVLSARGLLLETTSQIILAAAVVDDILGLLVLSVVSSGASGHADWVRLLSSTGLSIAFVMAALFLGAPAIGKLAPRLRSSLRAEELELAVAMVTLFGLAVMAEFAGVASIVGAFLAGLMVGESASERIRDVSHGATELLVPFFLVMIGLQVDLGEFRDLGLIAVTLALIAVAVVSKLLGCGLAALPLGKTAALRIGLGMIPRGEVGMIVAQIGLGLGALSRPAYSAVVCMAAATTLIAPPLLKAAHGGQAGVREEEVLRLG